MANWVSICVHPVRIEPTNSPIMSWVLYPWCLAVILVLLIRIIKFQLKWNLLDKSNLGEINENTSFQIEKDQEFSLFFRFMDSIQFSRIFHLHFFSIKNVFMVFKISEILLVGKILWEIMYHHDQITTMI